MSLISDCQQFLEPSIFKTNNLIVSYKIAYDMPALIAKEATKTSITD